MYKIINKKKLFLTAIADTAGKIIFLPKVFLRRRGEIIPDRIKEILIIRTAYIGDVIMTLPVLNPLRERFRNARISFLTSEAAGALIEGSGLIDEVITYDPFWFYPTPKRPYWKFIKDLRKRKFDLIIEARGDIRDITMLVWPLRAGFKVSYDVGGGGYLLTHVVPYQRLKHKVEYHLDIVRHLGCASEGLEWGLHLSEAEKVRIRQVLKKNGIAPSFVSVHPGARLKLKRWSSEKFASACDGIINKYNMQVVLLGAESEVELVDNIVKKMENKAISLAGRLDLRELAGALSESALFICNDSSPMHIAAAVRTPTVAIFGPSKSVETAPYGVTHRVVEKEFPCRYRCDENFCRNSRLHACMEDISVEEVLGAVAKIFCGVKDRCSG